MPTESPIDRVWRYVPARVVIRCANGVHLLTVTRVVAWPRGAHPESSPIRPDLVAVQAFTETEGSRWWGVEEAVITADLRMAVRGFPAHDEVRSRWEPVPEELCPPEKRSDV